MNTPLGRNGLIGLAVGATASLGLIALMIYREVSKRSFQRLVLEARPSRRLFDGAGAELLQETLEAQGGLPGTGMHIRQAHNMPYGNIVNIFLPPI